MKKVSLHCLEISITHKRCMQTVLLLYTRYIMQNGNNRGYGAGGGYFCSIVICDCVCECVCL